MNDDTSRLTKSEAALVIRDRAATYVDEHGADHTLPEFPRWVSQLRAETGAQLDYEWLADVLLYMEAVTAAENGTHPGIRRNAAQTVDTTQDVLDYENDLLTKTIDHVLTLAGYPGALTGKQAA